MAAPRCRGMLTMIKRAIRNAAMLAGVLVALPVSCGPASDGVYTGGIEPSPASRVNPEEPGFTNGGTNFR